MLFMRSITSIALACASAAGEDRPTDQLTSQPSVSTSMASLLWLLVLVLV